MFQVHWVVSSGTVVFKSALSIRKVSALQEQDRATVNHTVLFQRNPPNQHIQWSSSDVGIQLKV
jgi:hypothetical protein